MNGYAGLTRQKKQRQEISGLIGVLPTSQMENAGHVAGLAALIVNIKEFYKVFLVASGFCERNFASADPTAPSVNVDQKGGAQAFPPPLDRS